MEEFSRHTTCIPGRIKEGGCDSVGVVELPADPEWDEVPTPELKDSDSTKESERKRKTIRFDAITWGQGLIELKYYIKCISEKEEEEE